MINFYAHKFCSFMCDWRSKVINRCIFCVNIFIFVLLYYLITFLLFLHLLILPFYVVLFFLLFVTFIYLCLILFLCLFTFLGLLFKNDIYVCRLNVFLFFIFFFTFNNFLTFLVFYIFKKWVSGLLINFCKLEMFACVGM